MTIEIFRKDLIDTIKVHNREKEQKKEKKKINNERILLSFIF